MQSIEDVSANHSAATPVECFQWVSRFLRMELSGGVPRCQEAWREHCTWIMTPNRRRCIQGYYVIIGEVELYARRSVQDRRGLMGSECPVAMPTYLRTIVKV